MPKVTDLCDKIRHNLNLQSNSSRKQGNFRNSRKRCSLYSDKVPTNAAISEALRNPLILEAIFGKLTLPALKRARLVCHDWNDVAGTLLGKRAYLHVNKVVSFKSAATLSEVTPVHDEVIRRLLISYKFAPSVPAEQKALVVTNALSSVAQKGSQSTREIKFRVAEKEFIPAFLEGIRLFGATKIEKIYLSNIWPPRNDYAIPAQTYQKLPPQDHLTFIKFKIFIQDEPPRAFGPYEFQPFLQIWIDAATNLTSLDVTTNFYPNLEGCKNLKFLRYKFVRMASYYGWYPDLDFAKVAKMLGQVKDSLIELELEHTILGATGEIQTLAEVPVLSKLTRLAIPSINIYRIRDFFDHDHLPKLKSVSVNERIMPSSLLCHLNLWQRHTGVRSLSLDLCTLGGTDYAEEFVDVFPAVKEFHLRAEVSFHTTLSDINEILGPWQKWDLERVKVHVKLFGDFSLLVDILKAVSELKGVKSIQFSDIFLKGDTFSPFVEDVILDSGGFKSVEISGCWGKGIVERIQPIFKASGAPVRLVRDDISNNIGYRIYN
ncbi:uncharacterized protein LOC110856641 [Folsomia candida]|uniref:Toll-like receptor 2 n=1 Tax=Folsomia candida TaxID=158441 RepID=A0A226DMU2_FOLCA|nr:uncharacterized protein LOC110856641 [Folsomia candida]OXA46164.1 Toll-like receptor 2 [Folsomia candida]